MTKRVIVKRADGWLFDLSKPLSAIKPKEEPDMLAEYLHDIRYSYRKRSGCFIFSAGISEAEIIEVLQHFYESIADVVVEKPKVAR